MIGSCLPLSRLSFIATVFVFHSTGVGAYVVGRSRQVKCPMDFDVPLPDGKPSPLHLSSVANFLMPRVQDRWWTEPHVEKYFRPSDRFRIGPSKIAGCGVLANRRIQQGEKIGIVWVKDGGLHRKSDPTEGKEHCMRFEAIVDAQTLHFTPWYGRAVNHCAQHSNSHLEEDDDGTVYSVASQDIEEGEEVTGDYNEAHEQFPCWVSGAPADWTC
mmetsp:Transcript_33675/g.61852  ORF Transcript_33675/g.61852 Transcript_33675/m.61852 type:complete len:214 (+) Transcript_33675:89-730(+)